MYLTNGNIPQPYLQAHCQSPASPRSDQSFVKWSEAEFVNTNKKKLRREQRACKANARNAKHSRTPLKINIEVSKNCF